MIVSSKHRGKIMLLTILSDFVMKLKNISESIIIAIIGVTFIAWTVGLMMLPLVLK